MRLVLVETEARRSIPLSSLHFMAASTLLVRLLPLLASVALHVHASAARMPMGLSAEPVLFVNPHFIGPTLASNGVTTAIPLQSVSPGCWQLNLSLAENSAFVLASLDEHNDDSQPLVRFGRDGRNAGELVAAGAPIPVPSRGLFALTVLQQQLPVASLFLQLRGLDLWLTARINSSSFVETDDDQDGAVDVHFYFSAAVDLAAFRANFSAVQFSNVAPKPNATDLLQVTPLHFVVRVVPSTVEDESIVRVVLPQDCVQAAQGNEDEGVQVGRGNTAAEWQFIFAPAHRRRGITKWHGLASLQTNVAAAASVNVVNAVTVVRANLVLSSGAVLLSGWARHVGVECAGPSYVRHPLSFLLSPSSFAEVASNVTLVSVAALSDRSRNGSAGLFCAGAAPFRDGRILFLGGVSTASMNSPSEDGFVGVRVVRLWEPRTGNFTRLPVPLPFGKALHATAARLADGRVLASSGFASPSCLLDLSCPPPALAVFNSTLLASQSDSSHAWSWSLPGSHSDEGLIPASATDATHVFVLPFELRAGEGAEGATVVREVAMFGTDAGVTLVSANPATDPSQRFYQPPNGQRPGGCATGVSSLLLPTGELLFVGGCGSGRIDLYDARNDSWRGVDSGIPRTAPTLTLLPDLTVLILNGAPMDNSGATVQQMDALLTGEAMQGDSRFPQILDPLTLRMETFPEREVGGASLDDDVFADSVTPPFRGLHSTVVLLKDARVLVAGGAQQVVGCSCSRELTSARLFSPSNLVPLNGSADRPVWDFDAMRTFNGTAGPLQALNSSVEPLFLRVDSTALLAVRAGVPLRSLNTSIVFPSNTLLGNDSFSFGMAGVVLMAASSFSHGQDSNQRAVPLAWADANSSSAAAQGASAEGEDPDAPLLLRVRVPGVPALIPGEYLLFLVSRSGVPSVGLHTRVLAAEERAETAYSYPPASEFLPTPSNGPVPDPGTIPHPVEGELDGSPWDVQTVLLMSVLGAAGVGFFIGLAIWFYRQQREEGSCLFGEGCKNCLRARFPSVRSPALPRVVPGRHTPDSELMLEMAPSDSWRDQPHVMAGGARRVRLHSFDALA